MEYDEEEFSDDPADYYFRMDLNVGGADGPYFSITPKSYFDFNGYLLDSELGIDTLLCNNKFYCMTDSTYEYDGDPNIGRTLLLKLGFIENNKLL